MRVRCPKCDETFSAKANARRLKCPMCGFREEAPPEGFGPALGSGKRRPGGFTLASPPAAGARSTRTVAIVATLAAVLVLVGAAAWVLLRDDGDGSGGALTGSCAGLTRGQFELADPSNSVVAVDTSEGCFVLELFDQRSPITVQNFRAYVEEGFYTNLTFHRVVQGPIWVVQGGGIRADGTEKPASRPPIPNEASQSGLRNEAYTISMARTQEPDSATTQFFINTRDNLQLDAGGGSPDGYAVFGRVVHGREVVDRIQNAPVQGDRPVAPVRLVSMSLLYADGTVSTATTATATTETPTPSGTDCTSVPHADPAPHAGPLELDFITPGHWNVCGDIETMFLWAHNPGSTPVPYTWNITGPGGSPLPQGWRLSFQEPTGTLEPAGTRGTGPTGPRYMDWAGTTATLIVPRGQEPGVFPAELHAGGTVRPFLFHVQAPLGRVSQPGEMLNTHYDLRELDGTQIQEGPFCVEVGGQRAVTGYAWGVAGLALGEQVILVVPPAFHYGYEPGHDLAGRFLHWGVTAKAFSC